VRRFALIGKDGPVATLEARSFYGACLAALNHMGLDDTSLIEGTYRLRLPGGTLLYAVEVEGGTT
jgi:hypothetical protein